MYKSRTKFRQGSVIPVGKFGKRKHDGSKPQPIKIKPEERPVKELSHQEMLHKNVDRLRNPDKYKCKICYQGIMLIRTGKYGYFVGCNNYPECKNSHNY